jgi:5S rRNA maturation endonuclease (ribonuclease M5)
LIENKQDDYKQDNDNRKLVGVKYTNFNKKLELLHSKDIEILEKFGINHEIEDEICFVCGAEKLNFFYSKNVNERTQAEEKRGYLKCKCFNCNFNGDVIDIARKLDPFLKNKRNGEIIDFLLSKEFLERPNKIDNNRQYSTIKKVRKKQKNEKKILTYYNVINTFIVNFKFHRTEEIENYLYSRGFIKEDFKLMNGYVGLEEWGEYRNIIFPCSDYSFIRRLIKDYYAKEDTEKKKKVRYINSYNLEKTTHHCYLLEMIRSRRIIENNFFNIYVCEGVFDTLTVRVALQNKCLTFSSGGATSTQDLIANRIKEVAEEVFRKTSKKLNIILLFDNDQVGEKGQEKLYNLIKDCEYINVYKNFVPLLLKNSKDINEAFTKDRETFITNLQIIDKNLRGTNI